MTRHDRAEPSTRAVEEALASLREGRPALVLVAHPDDETLGLGGQLSSRSSVTLLHLTDGAPRDPAFARAAGFETPASYAEARRRELDRALDLAGVAPGRRHRLALADQGVAASLVEGTRALVRLIEACEPVALFTHAYEGGHPDHDAAAFIARAATRLLRGRAPVLVEMPYYHRARGALRTSEHVPADATEQPWHCSVEVELAPAELARKRAMLACFESQRDVIAAFDPRVERFRLAPSYDFTRLPHRGALHYETLGWRTTGPELCRLAGDAARALGLGARA